MVKFLNDDVSLPFYYIQIFDILTGHFNIFVLTTHKPFFFLKLFAGITTTLLPLSTAFKLKSLVNYYYFLQQRV